MTSHELRSARLHMNLRQTTLGQLMGVHQHGISRLETTRQPTKQQGSFVRSLLLLHRHGLLPMLLAEHNIQGVPDES